MAPEHEYTAVFVAAMGIAAVSGAAMLWCSLFGKGCEAVAPFGWPFGIPDGYIAPALYAAIL